MSSWGVPHPGSWITASQNCELDLFLREEQWLQVLELWLLARVWFTLVRPMLRYLPRKDLLPVSLGQVWGSQQPKLSELECWLQMDL